MSQPTLFDDHPVQIDRSPTVVHPTVDPRERPRLSQQCQRILSMLKVRPHSNVELAGVCLNPRARVSELRQAGHAIEVFDRNFKTGLAWYRLGESDSKTSTDAQ